MTSDLATQSTALTASAVRSDAHTIRRIGKIIVVALLAAYSLLSLMPFIWMALTSVKTNAEVYVSPPVWIPSQVQFESFQNVLDNSKFPVYFANSMLVAIVHTVAESLLAAMAGYAFARLKFRGRQFLFWFIIATMAIPWHVLLIPRFLIIRFFPLVGGNNLLGQGGNGFYDTIWALIIPGLVSAFGIFLFRQFFLTLPKELEDAARIDGASEGMIFWRIMLPLTTPALIANAIFAFRESWNSFVWPLIVTRSEALRTVQIGLSYLRDDVGNDFQVLMAASLLATLPLILIFIVMQRYFVQGIALTGTKG